MEWSYANRAAAHKAIKQPNSRNQEFAIMDRLTSMAVFVKAVDVGSFAAAADALEMSGPMVGKHVRFLEQRLGVRLLNRTTRRQSLTETSQALLRALPHCARRSRGRRCRRFRRIVRTAWPASRDHARPAGPALHRPLADEARATISPSGARSLVRRPDR